MIPPPRRAVTLSAVAMITRGSACAQPRSCTANETTSTLRSHLKEDPALAETAWQPTLEFLDRNLGAPQRA